MPDRDILPHHFTAKQTARCAVWRGAPLKAQVSFPAPKQSTPLAGVFLFCVIESKRDLRVELRAGASILPDRDILPHHFTAKQTARCAVWRGAPLKAQVSFPAPKQSTPLAGVFLFCVIESKRDLRVELRAGASILPDRDILPHHFTAKQTARCAVWRGAPPFSMAPLCKGSCQRQLTEGLYGVSLHFFGEKM